MRPGTGLVVQENGEPVPERYVLVDGSIDPDGEPLARDERWGLTLYRLAGPLVSMTSVEGVDDDRWSGRTVRYTRLRCRGGMLTVSLSSDPSLFRDDQRVVARVGREPVARERAAGGDGRAARPARAAPGRCVVEFEVARTRVSGGTRAAGVTSTRHFRLAARKNSFSEGGN